MEQKIRLKSDSRLSHLNAPGALNLRKYDWIRHSMRRKIERTKKGKKETVLISVIALPISLRILFLSLCVSQMNTYIGFGRSSIARMKIIFAPTWLTAKYNMHRIDIWSSNLFQCCQTDSRTFGIGIISYIKRNDHAVGKGGTRTKAHI